jgi:hypothetical protein
MLSGNAYLGSAVVQSRHQLGANLSSISSDRGSVRLACVNAFNKLNQLFSDLVFDLRRNNFQDFHRSFEQAKNQIEQMLNNLNYDRNRLVLAFNSEARSVKSGDNQNFDVRAALDAHGQIVLQFMDR